MQSTAYPLLCVLLGAATALACDANVVDAVIEPPLVVDPDMDPDLGPDLDPDLDPDPPDPPDPPNPLRTSLIHRYGFAGEGAAVLDSKGAAHGEAVGSVLDGDGHLTLAGEHTGQYVDLPNGMISGLTDVTLEAWLTWQGGALWQRIFDFGSSSSGEGSGPNGISYLFLTTESAPDTARQLPGALRAAYAENGVDDEEICHGLAPFPVGVATHVALVIEPAQQAMRLYQDGQLVNDCALSRPLSGINDVNNWLGHSNYSADADLNGSYDEFRIYDAALTNEEVAASFAAGPDAAP
jgi:hypothetical protein